MTADSPHVNRLGTSAFDLPDRLAAKTDPALIADDEEHFAAVARSLRQSIVEVSERLDAALRAPVDPGQAAMDRDDEVRRLTTRRRLLQRFGLDACLGRMVGTTTVYVGRLGLTDSHGHRLMVDWRSPAAEPFFGATHADPMGLTSRRRYRWAARRGTETQVSDYWDEVFTPGGLDGRASLDDQSAFIASLGQNRSAQMRDVLGTIAADQDAIIRAGSRGSLVVDGGPGTGKTVVALHRSAYLLYADTHVGHHRGGVLVVGPHQPYLAYVGDVLPSLGEDGVQTCTLRDLTTEGATAAHDPDPRVAALKSSVDLVRSVEQAVTFWEEPPKAAMVVQTGWADLPLNPGDWAEAFAAVDPGTPHNEGREQIWEALLTILTDAHDGDESAAVVRRALEQNADLHRALHRAWPMIEATDLISDLWSTPAYLRLCAPWLTPDEVGSLRRDEGAPWTTADLPLLDAARRRLGDSGASTRERRNEAHVELEREQHDRVIEDLLAADVDREEAVTGFFWGPDAGDMRDTLIDESGLSTATPDALAGPFSHVVVDEAQELTDAEWQMLLSRCPSRSFTIVGDRAQARHGFTESWHERLTRVGLDRITLAPLSINYRTPTEVMAEAEPVIRAAIPDANVPTSIRISGVPVVHGSIDDLPSLLDTWQTEHPEAIACVVGAPWFAATDRVRSLTAELSKGLEFDLVVLVEDTSHADGIEGVVDRYVAMTRATQQLVILTGPVFCGRNDETP
ncbi:RNA polymerase recycling motor ATPase HelR [Aeromicrobium sp. CF3.5]|uniref:RNA polymerase recycling motor ATPase HelR n=1 Tax=Aeromicrobium sp. CF3.5 TaxID=3373078 RepID=UPI003EE46CB9